MVISPCRSLLAVGPAEADIALVADLAEGEEETATLRGPATATALAGHDGTNLLVGLLSEAVAIIIDNTLDLRVNLRRR